MPMVAYYFAENTDNFSSRKIRSTSVPRSLRNPYSFARISVLSNDVDLLQNIGQGDTVASLLAQARAAGQQIRIVRAPVCLRSPCRVKSYSLSKVLNMH